MGHVHENPESQKRSKDLDQNNRSVTVPLLFMSRLQREGGSSSHPVLSSPRPVERKADCAKSLSNFGGHGARHRRTMERDNHYSCKLVNHSKSRLNSSLSVG
eukprot:2832513-Amphidinium_carterae.1